MECQAGDRIEVQSRTVGQPPRQGEVLEVVQEETADRSAELRVRWDDGHESVFRPAGGMTKVVKRARRGSSSRA